MKFEDEDGEWEPVTWEDLVVGLGCWAACVALSVLMVWLMVSGALCWLSGFDRAEAAPVKWSEPATEPAPGGAGGQS